ncbi:nitroreductase family protein [Streptomyces sp. NPDC050095]|uniref:Acg family FMN-binding oxidoreductase n=1 Tax=unclassified Streptomyces TaxID=2593676 RepID=UPI0034483FD1
MLSTSMNAATLEKLLSAAIAAPSMHNTQPWRFRFAPASMTVEIHAAPEQSLPQEDPHGRALHLAAGSALFNLRVAVDHFGWTPVPRLLPEPGNPGVLAAVRITRNGGHGTLHDEGLYDAIWRRHSSRFPFSERHAPRSVLRELAEAAHTEGATLTLPDQSEISRLLRLTTEAERRNHRDPRRGAESRRAVRPADEDHGSADTGIPPSAYGPQDGFEFLPMRDFSAEHHLERLPSQPFERTPTIGVLRSSHDRRIDWLRSGQALQHVLLVATARGLSTSLLHQAMEWPDLRARLHAAGAPLDHVQMLVRLGYGPEGPSTPRRTARQLLDSDGEPGSPTRPA